MLMAFTVQATAPTRLTAADSFSFILLPHNYVVCNMAMGAVSVT